MRSEPADGARTSDDLRSVPGWRRTGLVLGWGAVACAAVGLLAWLVDRDAGPGPVAVVFWLVAGAAAFPAPALFRRAWSVPGVTTGATVAWARRWSDVAGTAWCAAVVLAFVFGQLMDLGAHGWHAARSVLGAVLVLSYVGMLVSATRWRPAPADQL